MPNVLIEVRKKYTPDQEVALMNSVHTALAKTFNILNNDIIVQLVSHEPHRFSVPVTLTNPPLYPHPEYYTQISIDCFVGRTTDTKRKLYRTIADNLEALGIPKGHIKILLRETPKENWGLRDGKAGCDIEVGYTVEV